jgi:hypothetical protein
MAAGASHVKLCGSNICVARITSLTGKCAIFQVLQRGNLAMSRRQGFRSLFQRKYESFSKQASAHPQFWNSKRRHGVVRIGPIEIAKRSKAGPELAGVWMATSESSCGLAKCINPLCEWGEAKYIPGSADACVVVF